MPNKTLATLVMILALLSTAACLECSDYPESDEFVLNETLYIDFIPPSGGKTRTSEMMICREENVQPCEWSFDFVPNFETVTINECYVTHDGQKMDCNEVLTRKDVYEWSGLRTIAVSSPSCRNGDVYYMDVSSKFKVWGDEYTCFLGSGLDYFNYAKVVVEYPKDTKVTYSSSLGTEPEIKRDDTQKYIWVFEDVEPPKLESNMPPLEEIFNVICTSGIEDYEDYSENLYDLWKTRLDAYGALKEKAEEIVGNLTGEEAAEELYRWVRDNIQYVPLEYGVFSGVQPHEPKEVLKRGNGDCKDQTIMLVSLLKNIGYEAEPVLFGLDDNEILRLGFDHAIVKANIDGKTVWMDPTCESCAYGIIPKEEYGKYVLLFTTSRQLEQIPVYEGIDIYVNSNGSVSVDESGRASYFMYIELGDVHIADVYRALMKKTSKQAMDENLEELIGESIRGVENFKWVVLNPEAEGEFILFNVTFQTSKMFSVENDSIVYDLGTSYTTNPLGDKNRTYDYYTGSKMLTNGLLTLTYPEGYVLRYENRSVNITTPNYHDLVTAEYEGNTAKVELSVYMGNRIPRDEYNELRQRYEGIVDQKAELNLVADSIEALERKEAERKAAEELEKTKEEERKTLKVEKETSYGVIMVLIPIVIAAIILAYFFVRKFKKFRRKRRVKLDKMVDGLIKSGDSEAEIRKVMLDAGYTDKQINAALKPYFKGKYKGKKTK